jgi:hypothetical protein
MKRDGILDGVADLLSDNVKARAVQPNFKPSKGNLKKKRAD